MSAVIGMNVARALPNLTEGDGFAPGDEVVSSNGNVYRFFSSTDTIAQYDAVAITTANVASRLTQTNADDGVYIGVAQATCTAGSYGWAQVLGPTTVNCLSTCSTAVALFATSTAGSLDDGPTTNVKIAGITIMANITAATGAAGFMAARPFAAI